MHYFILFLMLAMSAYGLVSSVFVMLKLPYQNYLKCLNMQPVLNFPKGSFGQKKPVHCSFQGKWFSSYVVLASLWCEAQGAVFCFCGIPICAYGYILNTLHNLIYVATMHAWRQLAVVLVYILIYYHGKTASSIRRDLTRRLSFIIISVWLFGEPKSSEILS